jgi:hypothetical protein
MPTKDSWFLTAFLIPTAPRTMPFESLNFHFAILTPERVRAPGSIAGDFDGLGRCRLLVSVGNKH